MNAELGAQQLAGPPRPGHSNPGQIDPQLCVGLPASAYATSGQQTRLQQGSEAVQAFAGVWVAPPLVPGAGQADHAAVHGGIVGLNDATAADGAAPPQAQARAPPASGQPAHAAQAHPAAPTRPIRSARLKRRSFALNEDEDAGDADTAAAGRGKRQGASRHQGGGQLPPAGGPAARLGVGFPPASSLAPPPPDRAVHPAIVVAPFELHIPRRQRSVIRRRPRTGRASINRLKQAAHGTLPLGGENVVTAAYLQSAAEASGDISGTEQFSDESDSDGDGRPQQSAKRRRSQQGHEDKPRAGGARPDLQAPLSHGIMPGPSAAQRQMMEQIANAPPHMRQAILQQMMRDQLGAPSSLAGSAAPQLASLPREHQQAVVQQLMSRMTPQQRHALLQMPTQRQAVVLQQYYQEHVAPQQQAAAVAPPPPLPPGGHHLQLAAILANLSPQARAQLSALPSNQQQIVLARFVQQQQQQQEAAQRQRLAEFTAQQQQHGQMLLSLHGGAAAGAEVRALSAPAVPGLAPRWHGAHAPPFAHGAPGGAADLTLLHGDLFPVENGMSGMMPIASRADEADALQDAVDFFLSDS